MTGTNAFAETIDEVSGHSHYVRELAAYALSDEGFSYRRPNLPHAGLRAWIVESLGRLSRNLDSSELWAHQKDAVRNLEAHLRDLSKAPQSICVIPTGGGKTEIFQQVVTACVRPAVAGATRMLVPNVVVLVPTTTLAVQTKARFEAHFPGVPVGAVAADIDGAFRPVTVMTYAGFVEMHRDGRIRPEDVDLIVLDEAHKALSDLRQDVFGQYLGNTVVLAFTATPAFDEERNLHALLGDENETFRIGAQPLRDAGILAPTVNYVLAVRTHGDEPEDSLLARKQLMAGKVLDFYGTEVDPVTGIRLLDLKAMGYARDIEHAVIVASEYNKRFGHLGKRMVPLSGHDSLDRQNQVLADLDSGRITAVVCARLLEEGIDVPSVGVVLNFWDTRSSVKEIQRSGRALRIDPTLPVHHPMQTTFIIDAFRIHNGRTLGKPRFYFEAMADESIVRLVVSRSVDVTAVDRIDGAETRPEAAAVPTVAHEPPADVQAIEAEENRAGEDASETEGAQGPARRKRAPRPFTSDLDTPPDVGVDFTVRVGVVHVKHLLRVRDNSLILPRSPEWLTGTEVLERLDTSSRAVVATLGRLREAFESPPGLYGSEKEVTLDGEPVLLREMIVDGGKPVICFHERDVATISLLAGVVDVPPREAGMLTYSEFLDNLGISPRNGEVRAVWTMVKAIAAGYGPSGGQVRLNDHAFEAGFRHRHPRTSFCVSVSAIPWFRSKLGLPPVSVDRTEEWLTFDGVMRQCSIPDAGRANASRAWEACSAEAAAGRVPSYEGRSLRFEVKRSYQKHILCLHRDDASAFCRSAGLAPRETELAEPAMLNRSRMMKALDMKGRAAKRLDALYEAIGETLDDDGEPTIGGVAVQAAWLWDHGKKRVCIHESHVPLVSEALRAAPSFAPKGPADMLRGDVVGSLRVAPADETLSEMWSSLSKAAEASLPLELEGVPVEGGLRWHHGVKFTLNRASLPHFKTVFDARRKAASAGPRPMTIDGRTIPGKVVEDLRSFTASRRFSRSQLEGAAMISLRQANLDDGIATTLAGRILMEEAKQGRIACTRKGPNGLWAPV